MPYIDQNKRSDLNAGAAPKNSAELAYSISLLLKKYILNNKISYKTIHEILGSLEMCKFDFARRVASPFEDEKKTQNGDVY